MRIDSLTQIRKHFKEPQNTNEVHKKSLSQMDRLALFITEKIGTIFKTVEAFDLGLEPISEHLLPFKFEVGDLREAWVPDVWLERIVEPTSSS